MGIKLTTHEIRAVSIFERLAGVHVKDCLTDDENVYFLIESGKMGAAIGKNGMKIKNISKVLGKRVKVFEYAETPEELIKNFIPSAKNVQIEGDTMTVNVPNNERSTIIGKNGRNIKMIREFLKRHFKINNLRLK
ncbi:MAG: NusA-like transcription termination signal-binding factor [Candidatus Aenigmarchaeota archaeon]|nr:NusA-like transcription termination signal-binding factor [Candidatus Aenigmarchaeota archaeon]